MENVVWLSLMRRIVAITRNPFFSFHFSSSMPSQYIDNDSGDVVIMVPAIESDQNDSMMVGSLGEQSVCIDTTELFEPNSPKTMTESSSKSNVIVAFTKCKRGTLLLHFIVSSTTNN